MVESGQSQSQETSNEALLTHFPLFIPIADKTIVVIGGGAIASRRVETLVQFACKIKVVSPRIQDEILKWVELGRVEHVQSLFYPDCLEKADLVISATNQRTVNQQVGSEAQKRGVLVSVADKQEECTFFFPSIVVENPVVIGLSSQGKSPAMLAKLTRQIRNWLATCKKQDLPH